MSGRDTFTGTLEDCYRLHAEHVRRTVAGRITGDSDLADDACAFAWLQAARYWPIRHANPVGWVITVARRWAWAEQAKRQGREVATLAPEAHADPLADPQRHAESAEVLAALAALPDNQRAALLGRAIGLSYAEIADAKEHAYTWANRHVTEGRAALRAALSGHDTTSEG
jgi:DNA-directed RNA polymerase specialized sigma24 family protein